MSKLFELLESTALVLPQERLALHVAAASVPPGGTIVEVGTYRGMSSALMRQAAPADCRIIAVDPYPQAEAEAILSAQNVALFRGTARQFSASFEGEIDLLLIDGDHSFHWAREDFMALASRLKPGATVAFHDAGVTPFWGIRLILDALDRQETFAKPAVYIGQLALGRYNPAAGLPGVEVYAAVARDHLAIPTDYRLWGVDPGEPFEEYVYTALSLPERMENVRFIGRGLRGWLIKTMLDLPGEMFIDSAQATDPTLSYLVTSAYWADIHRQLTERAGIARHRVRCVSEFTLSRLLYEDLLAGGGRVARLARDDFQRELLKKLFGSLPGHELFALHQNGALVSFISGLYRGWAYDFG